jgi:hypothetical protein
MGPEEEPPTMGARVAANNRRTSGFIGLRSCANSIDGEQVIRINREEKTWRYIRYFLFLELEDRGFGDCGIKPDVIWAIESSALVRGNVLLLSVPMYLPLLIPYSFPSTGRSNQTLTKSGMLISCWNSEPRIIPPS